MRGSVQRRVLNALRSWLRQEGETPIPLNMDAIWHLTPRSKTCNVNAECDMRMVAMSTDVSGGKTQLRGRVLLALGHRQADSVPALARQIEVPRPPYRGFCIRLRDQVL